MTDIATMVRQAQEMQAKLAEAQRALAARKVEGQAGGGLVRVTLNGKGEACAVHIDPSLLDEGENSMSVLEDIVVAAFNDARRKVDALAKEEMSKFAGPLAGMMPKGFNPMG